MLRLPNKYFLALSWLAFAPLSSLATVNTEVMRGFTPTDGWSGFTEGSLLLKAGNEDLWQTGLGLRVQHARYFPIAGDSDAGNTERPRYLEQSWLLVGNLNVGKRNAVPFLNNGFGHARWTRMWIPNAGTEAFAQNRFNKFLRLNSRFLIGGNARVILLNRGSVFLAAGTGYMLELESLTDDMDSGQMLNDRFHRWNNYISLKGNLADEAALLTSTVYFQPRFDKPGDHRLYFENEIELRLVGNLSLATVLRISYDSEPPSGVKRSDGEVLQKLRYSF